MNTNSDTNSIQTFSNSPGRLLSKRQQEVLELLKTGHKQKDIAQRLNLHKSTVSLIVKILRKKRNTNSDTNFLGCTHTNFSESQLKSKEEWRFHGLELEVNPYYFYDRYFKLIKKNPQTVKMGRWRYSVYYKKIMLWLEAGEDFIFKSSSEALIASCKEINEVIHRLSNILGFEINKEDRMGINLLKMHLANTYAPEHDVITEKDMFISFRGEDGKIWLQYDRSKGIKEREYVHSKRAINDKDIMEGYFNDFRDNQPPTNSLLSKVFIKHLEQEHGINLREQKPTEKQETLSKPDYFG